MKKLYLLLFFATFILLVGNAYSQEEGGQKDSDVDLSKIIKTTKFAPGWGIGIKASTLGFGADIVKSFNQSFTLRLGASYYNRDFKISSLDDLGGSAYNYTTVGSVSVLFDWYFAPSVYLSTGLFYNMSTLEIESKATESQYLGDIEIKPETIGSLTYKLTPNEICPYLGIGFGHTISRNKSIALNFDLGVLYQGSPKVDFNATGMVSPTANQEQQQLLEDNVKDWRFYPFLNFQLSFRIF